MPFLTKNEQFLEYVDLPKVSLDSDNSHLAGHLGTNSCM